jgi:hypothetical protein
LRCEVRELIGQVAKIRYFVAALRFDAYQLKFQIGAAGYKLVALADGPFWT